MGTVRWEMVADGEAVAQQACRHIVQAAEKAIATRGRFSIALAGGRTPQRTYRLLSATAAAWDRWQIFFGDERCLPADDPQRNSFMAAKAWLERVPIPPGQIHVIAAELGPQQGARRYEPLMRQALPFDLALLGLGSDGHTASLFPGLPMEQDRLVQPVFAAPKPPAERVTLSAAALSQSREILVLVSGREKRSALCAWRRGEQRPISALQPLGEVTVIYDRAAGG